MRDITKSPICLLVYLAYQFVWVSPYSKIQPFVDYTRSYLRIFLLITSDKPKFFFFRVVKFVSLFLQICQSLPVCVLFQKSFPTLGVRKFSMLPFRSFIVLSFTFKLVNHQELIFFRLNMVETFNQIKVERKIF